MTTDWVQAALLPLFILVVSVGEFLILGFIPFRHELLRGEWKKEGLGGTGNQGIPIYSITDSER